MKRALFIFHLIISSHGQAAIFGVDDRKNIIDATYAQEVSTSVAVSLSADFVHSSGVLFNLDSYLASSSDGLSYCSDQKFYDEPTFYTSCAGFLIAEDVLVTAGHCMTFLQESLIDKEASEVPLCQYFQWVFDYKKQTNGSVLLQGVSADNIYSCKKVLHAEHQSGILVKSDESVVFPAQGQMGPDFAIIQLDRKVVGGRKPLKLSTVKVAVGESIYALGFPAALPMKISDNATARDEQYKEYFSSDLDVLGGNSGGPVFNKNNEVVGILVRSFPDEDYVYDDVKKCQRTLVCAEGVDQGDCKVSTPDLVGGSHVQRMDRILQVAKELKLIKP